MRKIKVFIVDDSAAVRQALQSVMSTDNRIEVIGTAKDPFQAAEKLRDVVPDVMTLDIEMPKMDGITFLRKIMTQHPIPVVICSSIAERSSDVALKALEYGAVDIITKPKLQTKQFFEESAITICDTLVAASRVKVGRKVKPVQPPPKLSADAVMPRARIVNNHAETDKVIIVGASTGGTEALREFLSALPGNAPGVVIVQHMPEKFTRSFAERMDMCCAMTVKEAEDNDTVMRGRVLIAPGNRHMLIKRTGSRYFVTLRDGPLVSRHRPSVDVLFRSASKYVGKNGVGVIMTGMGDDGARGMKEMHDSGAYNIAQDEASCVVFGMPKEAINEGGVDKILHLNGIASHVLTYTGSN